MKKFVAILLTMVMMVVMIPSFFASAAVAPQEETAVVAAEDSKDTAGIGETLKGFVDLWGGLLKILLGSEVLEGFMPALKKVLSLVSIGEFFSTVGQIWKDVTKKK